MTELVCIARGVWMVTLGTDAGELGIGPAFNEIVVPVDQQVIAGEPAYRLKGYEGPSNHENWYRTSWFAPLI